MSLIFVLCSIVLGIQIICLVLFLIAFSRGRRNVRTVLSPPPVSVIICAHDEEENLKELIPALLKQDHPDFEVIVAEDLSNDGTYDYLLQATKNDPRLRMVRVTSVPDHINGKKFALTLGIRAAKHDWVLLTDADCRPASNSWIRNMSNHFDSDKKIVIGFSPYEKKPGLLNSFIRFETLITAIQYIGFALLGMPYMGVGRNLAYRKSLFLDSKGFNNYLGVTGGDDDLFVNEHATRGNVAIAIGAETIVRSKPKKRWKEFYYQKLRHLSVGKRYRFFHKLVLGLFSSAWILSWFCLLVMIDFNLEGQVVLGLFLLRWIALGLLFHTAPRNLGEPFEAWKMPLLDFIYAFYYLVAAPVALLSKKVKWKV